MLPAIWIMYGWHTAIATKSAARSWGRSRVPTHTQSKTQPWWLWAFIPSLFLSKEERGWEEYYLENSTFQAEKWISNPHSFCCPVQSKWSGFIFLLLNSSWLYDFLCGQFILWSRFSFSSYLSTVIHMYALKWTSTANIWPDRKVLAQAQEQEPQRYANHFFSKWRVSGGTWSSEP